MKQDSLSKIIPYGIVIAISLTLILIALVIPESIFKGGESASPSESPTVASSKETETESESESKSESESESESESTSENPSKSSVSPTEPVVIGPVHSISSAEIQSIRGTYDTRVIGFGGEVNFNGETKHPIDPSTNRPVQITTLSNQVLSKGVNGFFYCGNVGEKKVAFSFQAGWEYQKNADKVLDVLDEKGVKAAFYITHEFAAKRPDLVTRMISSGHEVGSHSYAAPDDGIAYESLEYQMEDALKMQKYMADTFGYTMHTYNYNSSVFSVASAMMMTKMGYRVAFCSLNYADFSAYEVIDKESTLAGLKNALCDGAVYCFHMTNVVTSQFIGELIDYCRAQGYTIVMP